MASVTRHPNGRREIQFVDSDGKRRTIRLGKMTQKQADAVKFRVEHLVAAKISGQALDPDTAQWVADLDLWLAKRLVRVGLIPKPGVARQAQIPLGDFLAYYFEIRSDVKDATVTVWGQTRRLLLEFFGEEMPIQEITSGDAEEWRLFLKGRLSETTIRKRCQFAKQFFTHAKKKGYITANPFAELKSANLANPTRYFFLSRNDAEKVLDACPDANWRLLFALARYGGLRVPSEPALLKWDDVNWEQARITITSPKTEHHEGGESRIIPLFPELRPYLEDRLELEPDSVYLLPASLRIHTNPGTTLKKIIKRAGLNPWPKLWQNLRSTRQTELSEQFPAHVVCAWIGNSEDVAKLHYLQVTDDHFQKALRIPMQQPSEMGRNASKTVDEAQEETPVFQGFAEDCDLLQCTLVEDRGLEPTPRKQGFRACFTIKRCKMRCI